MKKTIIRIAIVIVVLIVAAVIAGAVFLDSIVKRGVETVGPQITKTEMKLGGVSLSMFSGSGQIKGFVLGNPEGYNKSGSAIAVGQVRVGVVPMSVFGDKVHVKHVHVIEPEISFEATGINVRANNLSKILENVQGVAGTNTTPSSKPAAESGPSKKLQVDDFLLSNAKVKISSTSFAGQTAIVTIPDIHFTNLGTGPDGITAAELTQKVMNELVPAVITAAQKALGDLGKGATDLLNKTGSNLSSNAVDKATKSVTDLLKKK